jgi:hypothetical protein
MRWFLAGLHLVLGAAMFVAGVTAIEDYWKTPSLVLLAGAATGISIGAGVLAKRQWVKWLLGLQVLIVSLVAMVLLAGSVVWPESAGPAIVSIYGLFLMVEYMTWKQIGLKHS